MDRFQALQVFVQVAEKGGFAAAGRELRLSPPAVTRSVAALEDRLGTRLFVRTTRRVRLTESGARFLADARRILAELAEAEAAAAGIHGTPRGELRLTAPVLFGRLYVAPILGAFLDAYPGVTVDAIFLDRVVNLMEEGLDVAVRIGHLPDSSFAAVRVGAVRTVVVAAPGYLEANGRPEHPSALDGHRIVVPGTFGGSPEWDFRDGGGRLHLRPASRLRVNTNDAALELARRGWGVTRLLSYQVAADVAAGRLEILLDAFEPPPLPVHIVHAEGGRVSARLRAFVDFAVARLRADPALR